MCGQRNVLMAQQLGGTRAVTGAGPLAELLEGVFIPLLVFELFLLSYDPGRCARSITPLLAVMSRDAPPAGEAHCQPPGTAGRPPCR